MNYNKVHEKMMRHVFLQTELLINDDIYELSEYDIQSMIFTFFRSRLSKYGLLEATREQSGRTDIVVKRNSGSNVYIELKTYFKPNELFTGFHFTKDFEKLSKKITEEGAKDYFIIAGLKEKFNDKNAEQYEFIRSKRNLKRNHVIYRIPETGQEIVLRPSQGQRRGRTHLWSWEVVAAK